MVKIKSVNAQVLIRDLREVFNNTDIAIGKEWLTTLRSNHEGEQALLNQDTESQIGRGELGDQARAILYRAREFSEEPLSPQEKNFLQKHRNLLY